MPVVHLLVMKLKIHHSRGCFGSAVVYLYLAEKPAVSHTFSRTKTAHFLMLFSRNRVIWGIKKSKILSWFQLWKNNWEQRYRKKDIIKKLNVYKLVFGWKVLNPWQVSYRMTIILFSVCTGNTCSAASPLVEEYFDNFGGDPFADDGPHDLFMRQVLFCNGASCGTVLDRTAHWSPGVMNLKLHHRQMHYRQSPFFNYFTMKTTAKGIEYMLPGHHKLKIYWTKSHSGGVNLVGLSL